MIIGLTGQIGAGKSSGAAMLGELGLVVIDADLIGRQVVDSSLALRRRLAKAFGSDVLTRTGRLRRQVVAERAFATTGGKLTLDRLIHPPLLRELRQQVHEARKQGRDAVVDAALLLQWSFDKACDRVLVIHAGRKLRLARLVARGMTASDAAARMKSQLPYAEFRRRADRLILNNGTLQSLRRKLESWSCKDYPKCR